MTTTYELYTNENGTPKAVEGKAPAIIERVEALEESLGEGVVTSVNGATGDVTPEQMGCLPLGGGMMTGSIKTSFEEFIRSTTNDSGVRIYGGNGYGNGSYIALRGKDYSEKGIFTICASDGTSSKFLKGSPDGSLTWSGNNVITSAGGMITGSFLFSDDIGYLECQKMSGYFQASGAPWGSGARITLYGKDRSENGAFSLVAQNATDASELLGSPGGALTWGGKNVVRSVNGTTADASGNVALSLGIGIDTSSVVTRTSGKPYTASRDCLIVANSNSKAGNIQVNGVEVFKTYDSCMCMLVRKGDTYKIVGGDPREFGLK